jgi:hypothetical protein
MNLQNDSFPFFVAQHKPARKNKNLCKYIFTLYSVALSQFCNQLKTRRKSAASRKHKNVFNCAQLDTIPITPNNKRKKKNCGANQSEIVRQRFKAQNCF